MGRRGQELAEATVPRFARQKLRSELSLTSGAPTLVGTVTPEASLKAEEAREDREKQEPRIWLAFITASLVGLPDQDNACLA